MWRYVHSFTHNTGIGQRDGQTDRIGKTISRCVCILGRGMLTRNKNFDDMYNRLDTIPGRIYWWTEILNRCRASLLVILWTLICNFQLLSLIELRRTLCGTGSSSKMEWETHEMAPRGIRGAKRMQKRQSMWNKKLSWCWRTARRTRLQVSFHMLGIVS